MRWRRFIFFLVCSGLIGYFGYHLVVGNHGLKSRAALQKQVAALQGELDGLKAVRKRIERDVDLMRADRLDPDMLDERARAILNFAHPDDIVIPDTKRSATGAVPRL